jgi:spore germination cell wall hydrolase CwlJ-like protein
MTNRLAAALRRADLNLASALFLGLATAAALAAYPPLQKARAPILPRFRPAIIESVGSTEPLELGQAQPIPPAVIPVPRPKSFFSRLRISVALENLAGETSCLAEALYYEARGQGLLGAKAIAEVVVRRTHQGGYPHSICGVVHQGSGTSCQFSFVCDGTMDRPKAAGEWNRAVRWASQIITGALPLTNITQGAISFHAATIQADWPGMAPTVTIGHNVFYRRTGRQSS